MADDSPWSAFLAFLRQLLGLIFPPPPVQPPSDQGGTVVGNVPAEEEIPAVMERKVKVIVFRPAAVDQLIPASRDWREPDDLIAGYIDVMKTASKDLLVYQVLDQEKEVLPEYPLLDDGNRYDDSTWPPVKASGVPLYYYPNTSPKRPRYGDYQHFLDQFDLCAKVSAGSVDEVWLFGGPFFGFYESFMVGRAAFWCNAPWIIQDTPRFVIMGYNYYCPVVNMVHDYGHRVESILAKKFGSDGFLSSFYPPKLPDSAPWPAPSYFAQPKNDFEQFLLDQGTVHRKPGGNAYGQDVVAWVSALQAAWWPPTIQPDRVR